MAKTSLEQDRLGINLPNNCVMGELHLIIGPMFSSKSSLLLQKYYSYRLKYQCMLINSSYDDRYDNSSIVTHDGKREKSYSAKQLLELESNPDYKESKVILIDEAQFFDDLFKFVTNAVENNHKIVFVAGLNGDFDRNKFGQITDLISYADSITPLYSICKYCKDIQSAPFSLRLSFNKEQLIIGESDKYVPVCRKHYLSLRV